MVLPSKWKDLLVAGVVLAMLAAQIGKPLMSWVESVAWMLVFTVTYIFWGRRLVLQERDAPSVSDTAYLVFLLVAMFFGPMLETNLMTFFVMVCPLVWVASRQRKRGIVWTFAVAIAAGVGASLGDYLRSSTFTDVPAYVIICCLTIAFSLAMGSWVTALGDWGREKAALLEDLEASQEGLAEAYRQAGVEAERARWMERTGRVAAAGGQGAPTPSGTAPEPSAATGTAPTTSASTGSATPSAETSVATATATATPEPPDVTPLEGVPALSTRELEVLRLISQGRTNRQIGETLYISPATVKTHVEHILTKLGATTRTQAVVTAHLEGLLPGL